MHFPWSTCAMMPMLRIWSLLETIFRMSAELLKRGNESYLSSRRDSAKSNSTLLYIAPNEPELVFKAFLGSIVSPNTWGSCPNFIPMQGTLRELASQCHLGDMNWR